jgi:hypothetical protein
MMGKIPSNLRVEALSAARSILVEPAAVMAARNSRLEARLKIGMAKLYRIHTPEAPAPGVSAGT